MYRLFFYLGLVSLAANCSHLLAGLNHTLDQSKEPPIQLLRYEGNFTDSDGDGMTDLAEFRYGFDYNDPESFPPLDFIASPSTEYPIQNSTFNNARIIENESGFIIKWDNNQSNSNYSRYSLTLKDGSRELYYGGHGWAEAKVNYSEFQLDGSEILRGGFSEYNPESGAFVRSFDEFEIDLSDYPLPPEDNELAADSDKITFRFNGFSSEQTERYLSFMRRVIPIMKDILGNPAETFVCDFNMDSQSLNSWVTLDQGRSISLDESWLPRLLVHEMIHMWKGKYAFSNSADNWSYSDDLSGFEEIAEGLSYEILHDFIEAYPYDENTRLILDGGPWWNWASGAANFDLIKHQKHTGGGTFWSGEAIFQQDRYSIAAMVIQGILNHDPSFMKDTLRAYYDKIQRNPDYRPTRNNLLDLWSSRISEINGIESRAYLENIPIFNGQKLDQRYYPVIFQNESYSYGSSKSVLGSYAMNGNLWWWLITDENIQDFNLPDWVKRNLDKTGYYYVDSNNLPFEVETENIFGEAVASFASTLDTGYQNPEKTIPNNLFTDRIEALHSNNLAQGLYLEKLTFTSLEGRTRDATETFYSFGHKGFEQLEEEYSLFIGVHSKFAEDLTITFREKSFHLPLLQGCAILKTADIAPNAEGELHITVNSFENSRVFRRTLVNAGSYDNKRHQQFLIIDKDFDGIEDLYDSEVDEAEIEVAYRKYKNSHPNHRKGGDFFTLDIEVVGEGEVQTIGFEKGDSLKSGSVVTIKALPKHGHTFSMWTGDLNSSSVQENVTVLSDTVITAVFKEKEQSFKLQLSSSEGGEIRGAEGLDPSEVEDGSLLVLSAFAHEGYSFAGWSGNLEETAKLENPLSIVMRDDLTLRANFSLLEFLPTISSSEKGILLEWNSNNPDDFTYSRQILTLKHEERFLYHGGHEENKAMVVFDDFELIGTETLRGRFSEHDPYTGEFLWSFDWFEIDLKEYPSSPDSHLVEVVSTVGGVVEGWEESTDRSKRVESGTEIGFKARSFDGYEFCGWIVNDEKSSHSNGTLSLTINSDLNLKACFALSGSKPNPHSDWSTSANLGNGWRFLEWFGYYYENSANPGWIYHLALGWVYVHGDSFENLWIHSKEFGWMWTKSDFFPYAYLSLRGWVFFEENRYYEFKSKKYYQF